MSFNKPPHNPFGPPSNPWNKPPDPWNKPSEPSHPWDSKPASSWNKPSEPPRPAWQAPPSPVYKPTPPAPLWKPPALPPSGLHKPPEPPLIPGLGKSAADRKREERALEDEAVAYLYWQKMRRDDGEAIEDDELVDAMFGESPSDRAPGRGSARVLGSSTVANDEDDSVAQALAPYPERRNTPTVFTVLAVIAVLAFAALMCWSALGMP